MGKWIHRLKNKDIENKTAECSFCGNVKIIFKNVWHCSNSIKSNAHKRNFKKIIKINQKCEICGEKAKVIDHCHKRNIFRGFLCTRCNIGLGFFKDNAKIMKKAMIYLNKKIS